MLNDQCSHSGATSPTVAAVGRVRWAHWPTPIKTPLWSSDAYPPEMVVPVRARFETTSAQPGLFRGNKVTPPTGFAVMSQTGREPAWLTTDFPCPKYDVSTNVDTGEPSTLVVLGAE
jgi:hypothetical protein